MPIRHSKEDSDHRANSFKRNYCMLKVTFLPTLHGSIHPRKNI